MYEIKKLTRAIRLRATHSESSENIAGDATGLLEKAQEEEREERKRWAIHGKGFKPPLSIKEREIGIAGFPGEFAPRVEEGGSERRRGKHMQRGKKTCSRGKLYTTIGTCSDQLLQLRTGARR